jgi:hypothetical protein
VGFNLKSAKCKVEQTGSKDPSQTGPGGKTVNIKV